MRERSTWTVEILFKEDDDKTRANAVPTGAGGDSSP